jgi:hypothetical protein
MVFYSFEAAWWTSGVRHVRFDTSRWSDDELVKKIWNRIQILYEFVVAVLCLLGFLVRSVPLIEDLLGRNASTVFGADFIVEICLDWSGGCLNGVENLLSDCIIPRWCMNFTYGVDPSKILHMCML